ncbi:CopG family transcriptional regulator [Phragmitibacter flavus]|uniref:CopG family transcriptional regulator n=1 Tax=Phragmitibacter flavus TaxID=2576071 RepID=A0A5R8KJJ9_9BACT|nr:CopG family transcriptional regulator [Phragmitibacter flavus]TLD72430.1 CopG family transcriptional regulator [Phragmitibacter flavus]
MTRTQIYLTATEAQGIARVAAASSRKNSEVIREAIDQYLSRLSPQDRLGRLRAAKGIWQDREELDLRSIREDFDRF